MRPPGGGFAGHRASPPPERLPAALEPGSRVLGLGLGAVEETAALSFGGCSLNFPALLRSQQPCEIMKIHSFSSFFNENSYDAQIPSEKWSGNKLDEISAASHAPRSEERTPLKTFDSFPLNFKFKYCNINNPENESFRRDSELSKLMDELLLRKQYMHLEKCVNRSRSLQARVPCPDSRRKVERKETRCDQRCFARAVASALHPIRTRMPTAQGKHLAQ